MNLEPFSHCTLDEVSIIIQWKTFHMANFFSSVSGIVPSSLEIIFSCLLEHPLGSTAFRKSLFRYEFASIKMKWMGAIDLEIVEADLFKFCLFFLILFQRGSIYLLSIYSSDFLLDCRNFNTLIQQFTQIQFPQHSARLRPPIRWN